MITEHCISEGKRLKKSFLKYDESYSHPETPAHVVIPIRMLAYLGAMSRRFALSPESARPDVINAPKRGRLLNMMPRIKTSCKANPPAVKIFLTVVVLKELFFRNRSDMKAPRISVIARIR